MPRQRKSGETAFRAALDFDLELCREKIPGQGEDSYFYAFPPQAGIVSVFDGCGGSGARGYGRLGGKTGAYLAARAVSGAVRDWFYTALQADADLGDTEPLAQGIRENLSVCRQYGGSVTAFKGSLTKEFPTTAALAVVREGEKSLQAECIWAGDSRCYLLTAGGLRQLTEDDLGGLDAMENLSADGVLTNVICASQGFTLHHRSVPLEEPCLLFAATDGCFGYLATPMEFEALLLDTLLASCSAAEWETRLSDALQDAGDDCTLSGMSLGFGGFPALQAALRPRREALYDAYIRDLPGKTQEETYVIWKRYREEYARYLSGNDRSDEAVR